jgi:hypothetical protein
MRVFTIAGALVLLFAFDLIEGPSGAHAQEVFKAHVGVVRFSNETGSPGYDAACQAVTDTINLTLRQLGDYQLQSLDSSSMALGRQKKSVVSD